MSREDKDLCAAPEGFPFPGTLTLVPEEGAVLVGVSGGVDSMVLLDVLVPLYGSRLVLCHVNHGLRGEASDGDEEFVRREAARREVCFVSGRGDVNERACREKISVELAAREFRYECFSAWGEETGAKVLFLAHHANDQAETVLFNLCRGSAGLAGVRAVSDRAGLTLLRPLLGVSRAAIVSYALARGLSWREDATNDQPVAARNRIRAEVIPVLESIMGRNVVEKMAQAARLAEQKDKALREAVESMSLLDAQGRLFLPAVSACGCELRGVILHWYLEKCGVSRLSESLVQAAEELLDAKSASRLMLPGGHLLRRKEKRLFVEWREESPDASRS